MTEKEMYDAARIAVRKTKDPKSFLRLGLLYAKGIGTSENHVLANYFYEKALALGCEEAEGYIEQEYESGYKDLCNDIEKAFENNDFLASQLQNRFKRLIEKERMKKNYGILSMIRQHLRHFYPDYTQEKAISDILEERDTVDAELLYATCTSDNRSEVNVDLLDNFLQQLYAPITQDAELYQQIREAGECVLQDQDEKELMQCIVNLSASYKSVCNNFKIVPKELMTIETMELSPYIKAQTFVLLRKQAFRCLLSIKDTDSVIQDKVLNVLESDETLLNVWEEIKDKDIQLFLVSFVELNIDLDTLEYKYQNLLRSFTHHQWEHLANCLNNYIGRLSDAGIKHQLPEFTPENLPPITL